MENEYPDRCTPSSGSNRAPAVTRTAELVLILGLLLLGGGTAAHDGRKIIAQGAESYGPVTPIPTVEMRDLPRERAWQPGDAIKEVPRRFFPKPGSPTRTPSEGLPDPLIDLQLFGSTSRAPAITVGVNVDGQGYTGSTPPDTVGDVGPDHYVQAVNASRIAVYDKAGNLFPGYPINLDSLAPLGHPCRFGGGDPIVLYDWLADRWFLQEFTNPGGDLCIYVSVTSDPTGSYYFYHFEPPGFPDYPHYGVWPDAYYAATNEVGPGGNQTTYAFDRIEMLAGNPATMQRLAVVPPLSGYSFQTLTPADHDGDLPPPDGAPGIFMRHRDDEAHNPAPQPATDLLEMWEMSVDWDNPGNTRVTALPDIPITDFNSWMVGYTTFFSTPQPGSSVLLDPIREAILQRLVYRNFGPPELPEPLEFLIGVFATNRDPATTGTNVEQGNRWFLLHRFGGDPWTLVDEGTFGGDTASTTANFFLGSVAMDGVGNIALGYSTTDVGASQVFPSIGFTGRLFADPPGTMGPENYAVLGGGPSSSGRWGDYAAMSVDPADDCTFWLTNEYIPVSGTWGTRITSFTFDECLSGFVLTPTPAQRDVCTLTDPDPVFDIDVVATGGWSFSVDLAADGEPPGTTSTFVPDNQSPDFTSTYSILGTGGSATGLYAISITGTGSDTPPTQRMTHLMLNLALANPGAPSLTSPPDGAGDRSLMPTFTWSAATDTLSYDLEVATDAAFTDIVYSISGLTGTSHTPASPLDAGTTHHWRLTAVNACDSTTTNPFSFTTVHCATYASTDIPVPIPEGGGTSGTTSSTLTIDTADGGIIADVNLVDLTGTHTYMGDLAFSVTSPAATPVPVRNPDCGSADNFDIGYDDSAAPGSPPCPPTDGGTYQPSSPLAAFNGEDSTGTWTLTVDDSASGDTGQLDSWSLEICIEDCDTILLANETITDSRLHETCGSITLGPGLTVEGTGNLDLTAPTIILTNGVSVGGTLSAGGP